MTNPYDILREEWAQTLSLDVILDNSEWFMTISGEDINHSRLFFPLLAKFVVSYDEDRWWLLSLEDQEHFVEFFGSDSNEDCVAKLKSAPEWAPGRPFPYAVRHQCYLGRKWLLLIDRDAERMHLIMKELPSIKSLACALVLVSY